MGCVHISVDGMKDLRSTIATDETPVLNFAERVKRAAALQAAEKSAHRGEWVEVESVAAP